MSVVVKKFTVQANGKKYEVGETISKLKPEEEKRLVDKGYCDYVNAPKAKTEDKRPAQTPPETTSETPPVSDQDGNTPPQGEESGPNTSIPLS